KTNNAHLTFSIIISKFQLIDWFVFLNLPLLIICWVYFVINITKINKIISQVSIEEIYNTIGS
ncbi:MAG: hypothetical protein ACFFD1_03535, partial [Candidatus Thorarchaeota archaeon]